MDCIYSTPQGIAFLHRQEREASHDQVAARFAGDTQAFAQAQQRQVDAQSSLLAIAEVRPS